MNNIVRKEIVKNNLYNPLTGKINNQSFFNFYESTQLNFNKILQVLKGNLAGCVIRNFVPLDVCKKVEENFWSSSFLKKRQDNVPAYYIGPYHYNKNLEEYIQQAKKARQGLNQLFQGTANFFVEFIMNFSAFLQKENIIVRIAEYNGEKASAFRLLSWPNSTNFSLEPHDDIAQCGTVLQKGFEIQNVRNYEVVAINICLDNDKAGKQGQLHYWNMQPDDQSRKILGIEETGYPYPSYLLSNIEKMILSVFPGDLYCFNGRNIHAVGSNINKENKRLILSFFIGFIDDNTIVYWV